MSKFTESVVEVATLAWMESLGYTVKHGQDIAPGVPGAERNDPNYRDVILEGRLRQALVVLNPDLPSEALDDAFRKLTRVDAPSLVERNRIVHSMLVDGITVEYRRLGLVLSARGENGSSPGARSQAARMLRRRSPSCRSFLKVYSRSGVFLILCGTSLFSRTRAAGN